MLRVNDSAPDAQHATTHFSTDTKARTVEAQQPGTTSGYDIMSSKDWSRLGLHDLLSQPVPIFRGTASAGTPIDLEWFPFSEPFVKSPFHLEKVRGYMGIRATLVVRLVVNADKYTQGRVALSYRPGMSNQPPILKDHRLITQLPHVELDVNSDTEVSLKIPHRGPYSHFDISNRLYNPGRFYITELLTHRGNPFTYTVYSSFEDVDLIGPTNTTFNATYQGSLLETEEKNIPMSQKIKNLSSAAMGFSMVPYIGSYIAPLAWASGIAGNVLSAFGYSKPVTTLTPTVYVERSRAKYNHVDGTDYAEPLAMTTTASVRPSEQVGLTTLDEMSLPYLVGIKSTLYRFSFDTTSPVGTKLLTIPLAPFSMAANSNITDIWIQHPIAYISNMFNHYRGSFSLSFEISKTIFHTGRLMVVFEPVPTNRTVNTTTGTRITTIEDAINCHKDIIDIRAGNMFTFDFPYTALVPYLPCEQPYGFVHLFVVNALVRNDTSVDPIVDVAVKVSGNTDFEFQGPTDPRFWPAHVNPATTDFVPHKYETINNVEYQSGLEVGDTSIVRKPIGSSSLPTPNMELAQLCVGENIRSLKQLAMRAKQVYKSETLVNGTFYNPFVVDRLMDSGYAAPIYPQQNDFYSYVGALYAYSRGGIIMVIESNEGPNSTLKSMDLVYDPLSRPPRDGQSEFALSVTIKPNGTERVYIPPCDTSFVRANYPTQDLGFYNRDSPGVPPFEYSHESSKAKLSFHNVDGGTYTTAGLHIHRAAAEDTQFGGFYGTPPVSLRAPWNLTYAGGGPGTSYKLRTALFPNS